jgi:hypothetical protein
MAENKSSFVLYSDIHHTVKHLTNEQAGELFKHLLAYVNDENPKSENPLVNIAFEPIKQQLKRDLTKWEKRAERSRANGAKGGRPKKPNNLENPVGYLGNPEKPKKPVNDNVNVNVSVNGNVKELNKTANAVKEDYEILFQVFWDKYNKKIDKPKCLKKWMKLSKKEIEQILNHVEEYVTSTPNKQYRKNPLSYLNSKSYENEIINNSETGSETKGVSTKLRESIQNSELRGKRPVDWSLL